MAPHPLLSDLGVVVQQAGLHEPMKGSLHAGLNLRLQQSAVWDVMDHWDEWFGRGYQRAVNES